MVAKDALDGFRDMAIAAPTQDNDNYPGSTKKRRAVAPPEDPAPSSAWEGVPFSQFVYKGKDTRFYTVDVLADMLGRKSQTMRKWERLGYLPRTKYRKPGRGEHGKRRLYTRPVIDGVVRIAHEEGITTQNRNVSATNFPARVLALFEELNAL